MQLPETFETLFEQAEKQSLYQKLIEQINKDFLLANIDLNLRDNILPVSLKQELHETIYRLIQEKFPEYLNVLYIIDVPEFKVKTIEHGDIVDISEQVTFLILQREWQKVWFKAKF